VLLVFVRHWPSLEASGLVTAILKFKYRSTWRVNEKRVIELQLGITQSMNVCFGISLTSLQGTKVIDCSGLVADTLNFTCQSTVLIILIDDI
jgi:hypothetical protein